MAREEVITKLKLLAVISADAEAIRTISNYVNLGGEINDYVQGYVDRADKELAAWIGSRTPSTSPVSKRKYVRRNLNPDLQNEDNNTIKIYCEGTCSNIGKENAKGAYGVFAHITVDGEVFTREVSELLNSDEPQSNQRSELNALYHGIMMAEEIQKEFPNCKIELVVSSMYVHRAITEWTEGWAKKEWKGVKHSDILRKIADKPKFPCQLIRKDSGLAGYTYARVAATNSIIGTDAYSGCSV